MHQLTLTKPHATTTAVPLETPTTWWGVLNRAATYLTEWHLRRLSPAVAKDPSGQVCVVRVLWLVVDPRRTVSRQVDTEQGLLVARAMRALAVETGDVCQSESGRSLLELAAWCRRAGGGR